MKTAATTNIETALANLSALKKDIEASNNRLTTETAALTSLESSCDLNDTEALNRIGQTQILVALLPRRIVAKEESVEAANSAVVVATNEFISSDLGPRRRELLARAKAKTRAALAPHFSGDALDGAVNNSELIARLEEIGYATTVREPPLNGAVAFVNQTLKAWDLLNALEKQIS